jgi:NADPH2:quinone reductase
LNFADIGARKGQYDDAPPFPFVPGYEVSGVIAEVGSKVENLKVGQKVLALTDFGGYAQFARAQSLAVAPMPDSWTFAQAAAVPVVFVTAFIALFHTGNVFPKDRVLIHACAGGLGQACLQLALNAKCEVIGTCGSDEKVKLIKEKGAAYGINYTKSDFEVEVKKITNGEGVDVIVDSVAGKYFKKDMNILRPAGRIVGVGAATATDRSGLKKLSLIGQVISMLTISSIDLMKGSKSFCGVNVKRIADHKPQIIALVLSQVLKLFESGGIKSEKPTEVPWTELPKAHSDLENRKTTGKLVAIVTELQTESKDKK